MYRILVSYAQKDRRFLFEKRWGQPPEFRSLISTIDGSTQPQVSNPLVKGGGGGHDKFYPGLKGGGGRIKLRS